MATETMAPPAGGSAGAASLPDLNAETYPFEAVLQLLDRAAYLNAFSLPGQPPGPPGGRPSAFEIDESLHRFVVHLGDPSRQEGLRASNTVGERVGRFRHRWRIVPDDFVAAPGRVPPEVLLDPTRSQRFVMLDGHCELGGHDSFRGFGTGRTFPMMEGGRTRLWVATVGTILEGSGRFRGLEGTYTHCGTLDPLSGFSGNLLLRVMDPEKKIYGRGVSGLLEVLPDPDPGSTYLVLRGQKRDKKQKTAFFLGPDGQPAGLDVEQQLRLVDLDASARAAGGLRTGIEVGPVVGTMKARIQFNLLRPGAPGTAQAPIPFLSYNRYSFIDRNGGDIGSFEADSLEGRTFLLHLPGAPRQQALRFGGFGPLLNGSGAFAGIQGLMTDNSVVGIAPHAIVTTYVLRVVDPNGRFRTALRGQDC